MGNFTSLFVYRFSFYDKGLFYMWKAKIIIKIGCCPNFTGFDSPMLNRRMFNKIWFFSILEVKSDIFEECRLVCFNCKMVMSIACFNYVVSNITLGYQGISSNYFAFNIDGRQ